jgi:predicted  nucleic acid-binding Zn-ribbon protein
VIVIEQIRLLRQLQEVDLKIFELDKTRACAALMRDQLDAQLKTVGERLSRNREILEEREKRRRKSEGDLAVEKTNLKKWKARLNESRNSRESVALVREIDLQEKSNRQMEEALLQIMIEADELKKLIAADEAEEAETRARFDAESKRVAGEIRDIDAAKSDLAKERAQFTSAIKPENLGRYDFIRRKRQGIAVTPVKNAICTGCHMAVSPQLLTILVKGTSLECCPMCQRIIYSEEIVYGTEENAEANGA